MGSQSLQGHNQGVFRDGGINCWLWLVIPQLLPFKGKCDCILSPRCTEHPVKVDVEDLWSSLPVQTVSVWKIRR